jgi:hypothetical protein
MAAVVVPKRLSIIYYSLNHVYWHMCIICTHIYMCIYNIYIDYNMSLMSMLYYFIPCRVLENHAAAV